MAGVAALEQTTADCEAGGLQVTRQSQVLKNEKRQPLTRSLFLQIPGLIPERAEARGLCNKFHCLLPFCTNEDLESSSSASQVLLFSQSPCASTDEFSQHTCPELWD